MLNLLEENKALCFEDSTLKPLYIFIYYWQEDSESENGGYWKYFTTIDKDIVLESLDITEGILEGNYFELGSFVSHTIKIDRQNNGIRYENMIAVPVQQIGTEYIAYFDGYVSKETISQDGQTVSMEIISLLEKNLEIDVIPNVKKHNNLPVRNAVYYTLTDCGIERIYSLNDTYSDFLNEDITINFDESKLPKNLTLNNYLKQVGEFLGCHIVSQEKRVVENLDDMYSYRPTGKCNVGFVRLTNVSSALRTQQETPHLPSEYKIIPYLQVSGVQYINTQYYPNINTRVEMEFQNSAEYLKDSSLDTTILFGSRDGLRENAFSVWTSVKQLNELKFDSGNMILESIPTDVVGKLKIIAEPSKIIVNGKETVVSALVPNFKGNYPLYLFANNDAGTADSRYAKGKLFSFKIFDNNILVRDMIPVVTHGSNYGLYDLVNDVFYEAITPTVTEGYGSNAILNYTPPYYISSYFDKTKSLKFGKAILSTQQKEYSRSLPNSQNMSYKISNNIFYEALSNTSQYDCDKAFLDVWLYLSSLDFYYSETNMIYAPFMESIDCFILDNKNQSKLPNGYSALDSIEIGYGSYIDTYIYPNSDNIEINIEFSSYGGYSSLFSAVSDDLAADRIVMYSNGNNLFVNIGTPTITQPNTINIDYLPPNQKINFDLKFGKARYEYSGAFSGVGEYNGRDFIKIKDNSMILGDVDKETTTDYKLYGFKYWENGICLCDMYPCISDNNEVGLYDVVRNTFFAVQGNPNPNYESGNIVIPILSTTTRGIHSMRTDVLCKAVNSRKN